METFFSLFILTIAYGLLILSLYPVKYIRKVSYQHHHKDSPSYLKYALTTPFFFSFLGGYSLAAIMLRFIL